MYISDIIRNHVFMYKTYFNAINEKKNISDKNEHSKN
jgi:hypothetical protein